MLRSGHAASSPSRALAAVAAVLCCFCTALVGANSNPYNYNYQTNLDALVDTVCEPPFGYLPLTCGDYDVIESRSEPVPIYKYGPNTCRTTRVVRTNVLEYRYRRYCDWVYSHYYYNWVQQCGLVCQPTNTCTDKNQTSESSKFECCEGYQTRAATQREHYNYFYQTYYLPVPSLPVGCPRAEGVSILECLIRQNLTTFLSYLVRSSYFDLLSLNDSNITLTVFAPTNAAFDAANISLEMDPDLLIGNHIVMGTVKESELISNRRFMNIEGLVLHSTSAGFPDTRSISYHSQVFIYVRFINGARVVNRDACITVNGTLHLVDRVLMPDNRTIEEILSSTPRYSRFRDALEVAGTLQFLMSMNISRTIFVPPNEVFDAAIPEELFNCLTAYMRLPLQNLVLHHISLDAAYSSTLTLQGFIYSLRLAAILVQRNQTTGAIHLNHDKSVQITTADIPAVNGVIHEIDSVLMPSGFTFGKCQEFAPTTPPPTTPPPTTPQPTTPPPTTPPSDTTTVPTTAPDSMVTDSPAPGEASGGGDVIAPSESDIDEVIDYEANP